jgi:hypothetical protein
MQTNSEIGKSLRYRLCGYVPWFLAALALVLVLLAGCATPATEIVGAKKDLLDFLRPGHTTREEVLTTLGKPSQAFEQEKILTYRLGHDEKQGYYVCNWIGSWEGVRYSLVLVFDSSGVLHKHNLVDVK